MSALFLEVQASHTLQRVHIQLNRSQNVSLVARNNTDDTNDTAESLQMHIIQLWFMIQGSLVHENRHFERSKRFISRK